MRPSAVLVILLSLVLIAGVACSDDGATTADRGSVADLSTTDSEPTDLPTTPDGPAPDGPGSDAVSLDQAPHDQKPPPDVGTAPDVGAGQCATHCDCTQGLLCNNGMCIAGFVPVYCCTKPGCPSGQQCENPDGSKGNCP